MQRLIPITKKIISPSKVITRNNYTHFKNAMHNPNGRMLFGGAIGAIVSGFGTTYYTSSTNMDFPTIICTGLSMAIIGGGVGCAVSFFVVECTLMSVPVVGGYVAGKYFNDTNKN